MTEFSMETNGFVREKLTEWGLSEFMQRFEDEGISKETFLSLGDSVQIILLFPKIGPRVKFRARLREYLQREPCHFVQDKLIEWDLHELTHRFEEEGINKEAFLGLEESGRINDLIPKTGPRVKFRARLREYLQREPCHFVQDKLSEWDLHELTHRFKEEGINKEAFLSLKDSGRINDLIPKTGPRVKFRKRLREYLQDLKRQNNDFAEMMDTNAEHKDNPEMDPNTFPFDLESASAADRGNDTSEEPFSPGETETQGQTNQSFPATFMMFYCQKCQRFMGNHPDASCSHCATEFNKTGSIQNGNFFSYLSLKELLKGILQSHGTELLPKTVKDAHDDIKDVMDGMMYQNLLKEGKLAADDLTLTWNFDEVPIFSTTRYSIWPLQFTINELPYRQRQENMMVAGIWFGQEKPHMNTFLKPFVDECCDLAQNPFEWRDSSGTVHSSKVFCLVCSSDAVARPLLRNCKQFNGEYGCDWCLHPGTMVSKGSGYVRSYLYDEMKQASRSKNMFDENAREAENTQENKYGVKGVSLISRLPLFDIVFGFVPEYLHSVILGVSKQLMSLWLNQENSMKDWYVGHQISQMDSRLRTLKPPSEVNRSPPSLEGRDTWKASEWRAFLLFYAISVLPGILQPPFVKHFFCLSVSIHILLQESISQNDLQVASENLVLFVRKMKELYGEENVSFNCHQLIHLAGCVRNWGPLWATSAFTFERNSANLREFIGNRNYNRKHIHQQFLRWQSIPSHLRSFDSVALLTTDYRPIGNSRHLHITGSIKLAIEELLNRSVPFRSVEAFDSFSNRNTVYHTANHEETDRTDCVIKLQNGCCGEIQFMLIFKETCVCTSSCLCQDVPVIVVQLYHIKHDAQFSWTIPDTAPKTIFVEVERTNQLKAFFLKDIRCKCMYVDGWLVPLPNSYERY